MMTNVGYRAAEVVDAGDGVRFPMGVMYPTQTAAEPVRLGPFRLDLALDAAPGPGRFPLVLISHGSGGTSYTHRTLAHALARHGFVVGLPEHPGNNRNDNSLAGTAEILADRPRHIRAAADWLFVSSSFAAQLNAGAYSVIGHSLGGYTALAVAGGVPTSLPQEAEGGLPRPIAVTPDPRVRALVLLAPATPWFRLPGSLREVRLPILMFAGEKDTQCPASLMPPIVLNGVPDQARVDYRLIPNAGHYSFLSPWPDAMTSPGFLPSQDPPGFDRRRFGAELELEVIAFLQREMETSDFGSADRPAGRIAGQTPSRSSAATTTGHPQYDTKQSRTEP